MVGNYVLRLAFMSCLGGFLLTARYGPKRFRLWTR